MTAIGEFAEGEIRIDTYRKPDEFGGFFRVEGTAVRVTHNATGIYATSQDERSVHANRETAIRRLRVMLAERGELDQKPESDREVLTYLMQQFDGEVHVCGNCGHEWPTKDCDSAYYLREYLNPRPQKGRCTLPPEGWYCTRAKGHDGPCAAHQDALTPLPIESEGGHND